MNMQERLVAMLTKNTKPWPGDKHVPPPYRSFIMPPFECADGNILSIQASRGHYCTPRGDQSPWSHVEVYFVKCYDAPPASWDRYLESATDPDKNHCYAFVPVMLVEEYLAQHNTWWADLVGIYRSLVMSL